MKTAFHRFNYALFLAAFSCAVLLPACSDQTGETTENVLITDGSAVLATVNGEAITEHQLSTSLKSLFGETQAQILDENGRQKALEALVLSRVIAQNMKKDIGDDALLEIQQKVTLYEEKLLVNEYLKHHAQPAPVTDAMITEYYESHPDQYGSQKRREFEMLVVEGTPDEASREAVFKALEQARLVQDWSQFAQQKSLNGIKLMYSKDVLNKQIHDKKLVTLVDGLDQGKASLATMISGRPHVVRITDIRLLEPVPLTQVQEKIRKLLAPEQIKQSVSAMQKTLMSQAEVVYTKN